MSNKPIEEKIDFFSGQSILQRRIKRDERPSLAGAGVWHFHKEHEITFTLHSRGKRFVGYNISDYHEYDFVLLSGLLPHCWITNQATDQIVINFDKKNLGDLFWHAPELYKVNQMLEESKQGIQFPEETAKLALPILLKMENQKGMQKLMSFLTLLEIMADSDSKKFLTFYHKELKDSISASNRIEKVYSYILHHAESNTISFSELSAELNMTKSAVCKFIKKVTKRTFSEIVMEMRIDNACKLLRETDIYIADVCFKCGFNNLSNFNRSFKKVVGLTPKIYRQTYKK